MNADMQMMLDRLNEIAEKQEKTSKAVEKVYEQLKKVTLTIENDIHKKISLLAEGHLDLNRQMTNVIFASERISDLEDRMAPVEDFIQSM